MPGLLRGMARVAVVSRHGHGRLEPREPPPGQPLGAAGAAAYAEQPPPPPQPVAAAPAADPIDQLRELGELRQQGILTEEEFAAQKAKILG